MITTERLRLRAFKISDQTFLYKLNNDKDVNLYRTHKSVSIAYCVDSIVGWQNKYGDGLLNVYLVEIKESEEAIGLLGIFKNDVKSEAEIGYRFLPESWGQGYCKEGTKTLAKLYFDSSNEKRIFAETHPENKNSIRFLTKNSFVEEKHHMKDRGRLFYLYRD